MICFNVKRNFFAIFARAQLQETKITKKCNTDTVVANLILGKSVYGMPAYNSDLCLGVGLSNFLYV